MADSPLINDLNGDDELDIDLMAAGCRVRPTYADETTGAEELLELYGFNDEELLSVIGVLVREGTVQPTDLYAAAERVAADKAASSD
ncbi:hypothetical protein [Nocardiopsis metallicus]|uniref:Uncharacterized protein n=1 Tax=Nocardiopsis metallicus TaxID=179819 RepID=A0A840WDB9_9ACTN|nr:hypothetical protein [Nocardiopsis metallicus]MBB5489985.1 hypothetical protein [Nocardiopsis metallicus]